MGLFSQWNTNKFSIYSREEKTVLKLLEAFFKEWFEPTLSKIDDTETLAKDNQLKKVTYTDLHTKYKLGANADFTGSWWGIDKPVHVEGGIDAVVIQNSEDIIQNSYDITSINTMLDDVTKFSSYYTGTTTLIKLQNAIDGIPTHGKLTLKQGANYIISGALQLKSNIEIDGNGATITQLLPNTTTLNGFGISNFKITKLSLIGVGTDYTKLSSNLARGIFLNGDTNNYNYNIIIEDCNFTDFSYGGICLFYSKGFRLKNNKIIGTSLSKNNILTADNYQFGIWLGGWNSNGVIENNEVSYTAQGIFNGYEAINLKYLHNDIHDIKGQHGFYISHGNNLSIIDNTVTRCENNGIKIQQAITSIAITNNVHIAFNKVSYCGDTAIALLKTEPTNIYQLFNISVEFNLISNCSSCGIMLQYCNDSMVCYNTILNDLAYINDGSISGKYGIFVTSSKEVSVIENKVKNTNWTGLYFGSSSDLTITRNKVINPAQAEVTNSNYGLYLTICDKVTVDKNIVKDSNLKMLYSFFVVTTTNFEVTNNKFLDVKTKLYTSVFPSLWENNITVLDEGYPNTIIQGQKAIIYHGQRAQAPTTSVGYKNGDRYEYTNPIVGGYIGEILITDTWKTYGLISS